MLDLEDFLVSNNILPLGSLIFLAFCTTRYGWGWNKFIEEVDTGKGISFPKCMRFYATYILLALEINMNKKIPFPSLFHHNLVRQAKE